MNVPSNRRRFLELTGVGAAATLAGCNQFDTSDDAGEPDDSGFDPSDGVVTQVGPDQQEMQTIQQEVMAEAEEEGWDQSQMQAEVRKRQQARIKEEVQSFDSFVDETDAISIEDRAAEMGVFLLGGSDAAILDALREEEIDALFPGVLFESVQSSQE